ALLDVLAVVALLVGQAEEALLEDRVFAVPEGQGEAQAAFAVGQAEQAVFAPAVGPAVGVVEGEVVPGAAVGRVVLADGGPLALAEVRAPALPVPGAAGVLLQPAGFGVGGRGGVSHAGASEFGPDRPVSAPEGRRTLAQGDSPGYPAHLEVSPGGAAEPDTVAGSVAPPGLA